MGYIKHNAIIVTSWQIDSIKKLHKKALEIFGTPNYKAFPSKDFKSLVSPVIEYTANEGASFFIAPDGSKEGWAHSLEMDKRRDEFLGYLKDSDFFYDYVEIRFGGDNDAYHITRNKHMDYDKD